MALHTMAILQAYQADIFKEMDEGGEKRKKPRTWPWEPLSTLLML